MKKYLLAVCLCLAGCKAATVQTPTIALIPGAINSFDQTTYQTLVTAHSFAQQAAANSSILTTAQKKVLNQFILDLNSADTLYAAYHALEATQAQMQASLTAVQTDQATFAAGAK